MVNDNRRARRVSMTLPLEKIPQSDLLPTCIDVCSTDVNSRLLIAFTELSSGQPSNPHSTVANLGAIPIASPLVEAAEPVFTGLSPPPTPPLYTTKLAPAAEVDIGGQEQDAAIDALVKTAAEAAAGVQTKPELEAKWEGVLTRAIRGIVSLSTIQVRSFDTDIASKSEAALTPANKSGFVVDLKRGIILSNRHVVSSGPIICESIFYNHDETPAFPIYRDPVHDFGFFKIDPSKLKYSRLTEIPLCPEVARIGLEIRVLGNDAGERMSILSGTLARLDRPAPYYGLGKYNDFNTFYYQAASSTSGGSSGSPVLDIEGRAVALNAGGRTSAASSFYLPLERVVRALKLIQNEQPVSRGTLMTIFQHKSYAQLKRLGLSPTTEHLVRRLFPAEIGLLVVHKVLQGGAAHNKLLEGDILVRVNSEVVTSFISLEEILDDSVGEILSLTVERGGQTVEFDIKVADLHRLTPSEFVEYSGGVFHDVSYQVAQSFGVECRGVFVASAGYSFALAELSRNCLILALNGEKINNISDFIRILSSFSDGERISVRFCYLHDLHRHRVTVLTIDRKWHLFRVAKRNDRTGLWDYKSLGPPPSPTKDIAGPSTFTRLIKAEGDIANAVIPSVCVVGCRLPFLIDGLGNDSYVGLGTIVSKEHGLVVCDKSTVPLPLGDIRLTIANTLIVPAQPVFMHPIHNFVILQYDASILADTCMKDIKIDASPIASGDKFTFVGIMPNGMAAQKETKVSALGPSYVSQGTIPKYRPFNIETVGLETTGSGIIGGLIVSTEPSLDTKALNDTSLKHEESEKNEYSSDKKTKKDSTETKVSLRGLWTCYTGNERGKNRVEVWSGEPMHEISRILSIFMNEVNQPSGAVDGKHSTIAEVSRRVDSWGRALDAFELWPISLAAGISLGLPLSWVTQLEELEGNTRKVVLEVIRKESGSKVSDLVMEGDLLVAIDGHAVVTLLEVEKQVVNKEEVELTIIRAKEELKIKIPTSPIRGTADKRVIGWCGALLQTPHKEVAHFSAEVPSQCYVGWVDVGSPAEMYALYDNTFIIRVNEQPVRDLDDFIKAVENTKHGEFVRLRVMDAFRSTVRVLAIKALYHYHPCFEVCARFGEPPQLRIVKGGSDDVLVDE